MTELILVRGLHGSGKSTWAQALVNADPRIIHVEADNYMRENGKYCYRPEKISYVHECCKYDTRRLLEAGRSVVVANTFTRCWEMWPYAMMALDLGCKFTVKEMTGNYGSIHNVPEESMEKMRKRWETIDSRWR